MRLVALTAVLASTTILGGCAGTIAGVSLSSISSFAGFASTIFTGADLGEHAVSLVTGKDCRFSEGLVREDRDICEEPGSAATLKDFHGIFVDRIEADGTVVYAAPKYMPVNLGAGEGEATTDKVWAEIKTAKAEEDTERQLARANAQQQIDVAALATTTLSSEALAFMPTNSSDFVDGDTASQTAHNPRSVVNAAAPKPAKDVKQTAQPAPVVGDQPALDATTFAEATPDPMGAGEGGPLIAASNGTPVTSKLINGEPVVVLRLRPVMSASTAMPIETAAAMPSDMPQFVETAAPLTPTKVATRPSVTPRSPQMIITDVPVRPSFPATPTRVAQVDPLAGEATKPRAKPAVDKPADKPVVEKPAVAALATTKPATGAPRKPPAPTDAYEPVEDAAYTGSVPVQTPGDVPAHAATQEPASGTAFSQPDAAAAAPSPLIPMQQE